MKTKYLQNYMNYPLNPDVNFMKTNIAPWLGRVGSLEETAGLILQFNLQIVERTKTETRNIIGFTFNSELLTNLVTNLFNICLSLA